MDRERFGAWLERYVAAWRSYDPTEIGDLFSEDAEYRYYPWEDPVQGRDKIVAAWLENQDAPGSWEASYRPVAIDGDVAVAIGRSRYVRDEGSVVEYHNAFVTRFDADGRCREFTEYYIERPRNP
jgi:ketosteroid isomerase-like protein